MPPRTIQPVRECHADLVLTYREKIQEISTPRFTSINGVEQRTAVPSLRQFFPLNELRRIFTIDHVKAILNHNCNECPQHLSDLPMAQPSAYAAENVLRTDATLSLFALLVFLKYPLLFGIFWLRYDLDVLPLPRYFSPYDLQDRYFQHLPSNSARILIEEFQTQKWRFSVPTFGKGRFEEYEEGTILPYLDEQPIGRGGFSRVYKVWVHPYYCTLNRVQTGIGPQGHRGKIFARKEIIEDDDIEFLREKTNLEHIARLQDLHLVNYQKTYKLGRRFNILFPYAKTNLHDYLRDSRFHAPDHPRVSRNPMWEQTLGITRALDKLINFTKPDSQTVLFGYHMDLKPRNILIDNTATGSADVFKITDFGLTQFVDPAFQGTSRIIGAGGTDEYAPPEYLQHEYDRTYDVWSLGIIVLEILAFAIRGSSGLTDRATGLDHIRRTRVNESEDTRFYILTDNTPIVKPIISQWMDGLLETNRVRTDTESHEFVTRLLALIKLMLEPQRRIRISVSSVKERMAEIFKLQNSEDSELVADAVKENDEVVLVDLKKVDYYAQGVRSRHSVRTSLVVLERFPHRRLRTWIGKPLAPLIDQRQDMSLIMAFKHQADADDNFFELSFAHVHDEMAVSLQDQAIVLSDERVATRLQKVFLGQAISNRYRITGVKVSLYKDPRKALASLGSKIISKLSVIHHGPKQSENQDPEVEPTPSWIELWIERTHALENQGTRVSRLESLSHTTGQFAPLSPIASTSGNTSRPPRQRDSAKVPRPKRQVNPANHVPLGRVVVYFNNRIMIIPFTQEGQIVKCEDMRQVGRKNVTFNVMDRRQVESFPASYLVPSAGRNLPNIPMHHPVLKEAETKLQILCDSIEVEFEKPEDAFKFYQLYLNEKTRWLDSVKGRPDPHPTMMPLD